MQSNQATTDNGVGLVLPDDSKVYGIWLRKDGRNGSEDAHVLVNENKSVVVGRNTPDLYNGKLNYTNPALVISKDECYLQYQDDKGKYVTKKLLPEQVRTALFEMLEKLKA